MKYVPALDGLRAISVLGVLLSHYKLGVDFDFLERALPWGHIGVRIFFVLSGFLITTILLNCRYLSEKEGLSSALLLRQFYWRRFLRIFPLFYGVIFVAYFLDMGNIREIAIYHIFYLSNTSGALTGTLKGFPPLIDPTTAHFWSLAVEEQFYLIWPLMVLFVSRKILPALLVVIILMSPILRFLWFVVGYDQMYSYLPLCSDTLGLGAFLALYRSGDYQGILRRPIILKSIFYVSFILLLGLLWLHTADIWYRPRVIVADFFEGIIYVFLISFIIDSRYKKLNKILENNILRYIGTISYGIYILHAFSPHIFRYFFVIDTEPSILMFFVYTLISILMAALSYKIYEAPLNKFKKYFPYDYR